MIQEKAEGRNRATDGMAKLYLWKAEWADSSKADEATDGLPVPILDEYKGSPIRSEEAGAV